MPRGRVKPSPWSSAIALVIGIAMAVLGFRIAVGPNPSGGVVIGILGLSVVVFASCNLFTRRGVALYEVDIEEPRRRTHTPPTGDAEDDFDTKLRKLAKLHEDGLVTDEEFERKRAEILAEKW